MILPPELVDKIITYLRHDKRTLGNCSLVAKPWTYSSQKLLYTSVRVTPSRYQTWQEIASPTSAKLLQHTRSLACYKLQSLHDFHEEYLKSFHRLQHLTLDRVCNVDFNAVSLFPALQNTLSSLSLSRLSLTLDTLVSFLSHFSNLRAFHLSEPTFTAEHRTVPLPSTPPRGTLRLSTFSTKSTDILLRTLTELKPEYDKLEIFEVRNRFTLHVHPIVSTCERTLTHLNLGPNEFGSLHTLENLPELRKLVFTLSFLYSDEVSLISTITSTNIQKILFAMCLPRNLEDRIWLTLDAGLSSLVDRLRESGYRHTLELEFQITLDLAGRLSDVCPDTFLPKFSEKGRVIVSETTTERVLYCFDGSLQVVSIPTVPEESLFFQIP